MARILSRSFQLLRLVRSSVLATPRSNVNPRRLNKYAAAFTRPYTDPLNHKIDSPYSRRQLERARQWLSAFQISDIPRDTFEKSYSHSGGPGGQNVNKLNSKVTITCNLSEMSWMPPEILDRLQRRNFRYLTKHDKVVVHSDKYRHRQDNLEDCFSKLHSVIIECAQFPEDVNTATINKWNEIKKRTNENRLISKHHHSMRKQGRKAQFDE
ncbi:hypothetical protein V1511DRAFT_491503 [Dipodascopsis uninucleata]